MHVSFTTRLNHCQSIHPFHALPTSDRRRDSRRRKPQSNPSTYFVVDIRDIEPPRADHREEISVKSAVRAKSIKPRERKNYDRLAAIEHLIETYARRVSSRIRADPSGGSSAALPWNFHSHSRRASEGPGSEEKTKRRGKQLVAKAERTIVSVELGGDIFCPGVVFAMVSRDTFFRGFGKRDTDE